MSVRAVDKFKTLCFSAPLFFLLFATLLHNANSTSEGLYRMKREHLVDKGVLAGTDFLSVLFRDSYKDPKNPNKGSKTTPSAKIFHTKNSKNRKSRIIRSTIPDFGLKFTNKNPKFIPTSPTVIIHHTNSKFDQKIPNDEVIVSVRVSSSVNKNIGRNHSKNGRRNNVYSSNHLNDHVAQVESEASENHPVFIEAKFEDNNSEPILSLQTSSIVAESKRNNLALEEKEPIVTNTNPPPNGFDLNLQPVDNLVNFPKKVDQFHQSIVYHGDEPDKARSISYSSVVQNVPPTDSWSSNVPHERQERNYDSAKSSKYNGLNNNPKYNLSDYNKDWNSEKTTTQKPRHWVPPSARKSFSQPEDNYEVDEHASVVSNGRVHGIQMKKDKEESQKIDDNQKVGYVVEGRNYRKYRVEERTSDGFIVGEYGVVSHNDGSLRGVRYTADGNTNPRLIYDALMKFLSL